MRVATYNVQDLFLHGEGSAKPEKAVRPLARMIDQVEAQFLLVQEVGSLASLETLNRRLRTPFEHIELVPGNSTRSIHLGVLSRTPVSLTSHRTLKLTDEQGQPLTWFPNEAAAIDESGERLCMQRDILLAETCLQTCRLAFFGVHLKSRTNRPWQSLAAEEMRAAEVRALAQVVDDYRQRQPDTVVVVLGDFNDRWHSDALAPLHKLGLRDPLGEALKRSGRNPSTYWPKRRMRIDHILLASDQVDATAPTIHSNHMARQASDHYPVSLELNL